MARRRFKTLKEWRGIKNPKFHRIKRNKDDKGRLLTYSVKVNKVNYEVNTLREARIIAIKL